AVRTGLLFGLLLRRRLAGATPVDEARIAFAPAADEPRIQRTASGRLAERCFRRADLLLDRLALAPLRLEARQALALAILQARVLRAFRLLRLLPFRLARAASVRLEALPAFALLIDEPRVRRARRLQGLCRRLRLLDRHA